MTARRNLAIAFSLVCGAQLFAGARLPTGATLDPAAKASPVGNFPLGMTISPDGERIAVLLCGWRQQGVQIADRSGAVLQTLEQPAAVNKALVKWM